MFKWIEDSSKCRLCLQLYLFHNNWGDREWSRCMKNAAYSGRIIRHFFISGFRPDTGYPAKNSAKELHLNSKYSYNIYSNHWLPVTSATLCDLLWSLVTSCNIKWQDVTSCTLIRPQPTSCDLRHPHETPAALLWPQPSSCDLSRLDTTKVELK